MHRTQIILTDAQYARLRQESAATGRSLAELIRRALDEGYGEASDSKRLRLLDRAFGAWGAHDETGEAFVERIRTGSARRLTRSG